jgi:hypothetical protein
MGGISMALTKEQFEYRVAFLVTNSILLGALGIAAFFTGQLTSEENTAAQTFAAVGPVATATGVLTAGLWYPLKSLVKGFFCAERADYIELPDNAP